MQGPRFANLLRYDPQNSKTAKRPWAPALAIGTEVALNYLFGRHFWLVRQVDDCIYRPNGFVPQRFFAHQQKSGGDRHMYTVRSRFIPSEILDRFDSRAWPPALADNLMRKHPTQPTEISARVRQMWR